MYFITLRNDNSKTNKEMDILNISLENQNLKIKDSILTMDTSLIGYRFKMRGRTWRITTEVENGWIGCVCDQPNGSFISMNINDINEEAE